MYGFLVTRVGFPALCALILAPGLAMAQNPTRSLWNHNGSSVSLAANGDVREFYYEEPRPGMLAAGAQQGSLLFRGRSVNGNYVGTAYTFDKKCGTRAYDVSGPILDHYERVLLRGQAPRVGSDCRVRGYVNDTLEFTLLKPGQTASSPGITLPASFVGIWIEAGAKDNACKASEWENRGSGEHDYEYFTRLTKVTNRSMLGWESSCDMVSIKTSSSNPSGQETVEMEMACGVESISFKSTQFWSVQTIDGRKNLVTTGLKTWDTRDDSGKRIPDQSTSKATTTFLECK